MSNTVPAQHPAVVLRSSYQHLRTLLAIATIAIVGLTVALVVVAINNSTIATARLGPHATPQSIHANASADTGARINHSGRLQPSPPQPTPRGDYPGR